MTYYKSRVVGQDPVAMALQIIIGFDTTGVDGRTFTYVTELAGPNGMMFKRVSEGEIVPPLLINEEVAKALYDALHDHFGLPTDARRLRQDYIAERGRVDKFIDYMVKRQP